MGLQKDFGLATVFLWAEEGGQMTISEQAIDHRTNRNDILDEVLKQGTCVERQGSRSS